MADDKVKRKYTTLIFSLWRTEPQKSGKCLPLKNIKRFMGLPNTRYIISKSLPSLFQFQTWPSKSLEVLG